MISRFVQTDIGKLYTSYRAGEKTILFLSGAGLFSTEDNFAGIIDLLPTNFGVLTIDFPNTGKSPYTDQNGVSVSLWIKSIIQVIEFYEIQNYIICAHSISGILALALTDLQQNHCVALFLIEPTTYQIMYGDLSRSPYPEMIELQEKYDTDEKMIGYLKSISELSLNHKENEQLWTQFDENIRSLVENPLPSDFRMICDYSEEEFQKLADRKIDTPIFIFTQKFRYDEYKNSEYNQGSTGIVCCGDSHYLHWTDSDKILFTILKYTDNMNITNEQEEY